MNYFFIFILLFLLVLSIIDIKKRIVPNYFSYIFISISLLYQILVGNWLTGIIGLLTGFIAAYVLCEIDFWGGGDGKVLIGIAILLGSVWFMIFLLVSFIIGLFWKLIWQKLSSDKNCPFIPVFLICLFIFTLI